MERFKSNDKDLLAEVVISNQGGKSHHSYDKDEPCDICWDPLKNKYTIVMSCNHKFHRHCILANMLKFNKPKCPMCAD